MAHQPQPQLYHEDVSQNSEGDRGEDNSSASTNFTSVKRQQKMAKHGMAFLLQHVSITCGIVISS